LINLLSSADEASCEAAVSQAPEGALLDFRDLLLPEAQARLLGGTGESPYGSLVSTIFKLIKDKFFVENPNKPGLASINQKLIAKLGESETPGRWSMPGSIFNVDQNIAFAGLKAGIKLDLSELSINNIDSFGVPLSLFDPVDGEAYMLNNSATIGVGRPLELAFRFFLGFYGEDDAEPIENDVTVVLDMDTLKLLVGTFLQVSERAFMDFPIEGTFC